jgi:hypothetical protein
MILQFSTDTGTAIFLKDYEMEKLQQKIGNIFVSLVVEIQSEKGDGKKEVLTILIRACTTNNVAFRQSHVLQLQHYMMRLQAIMLLTMEQQTLILTSLNQILSYL